MTHTHITEQEKKRGKLQETEKKIIIKKSAQRGSPVKHHCDLCVLRETHSYVRHLCNESTDIFTMYVGCIKSSFKSR